jgi:hypothetical protein
LGVDFIICFACVVLWVGELGYTQAVDVKLVADSQDNRKGHYGEDNNIYLNDTNLNNTKDLATTLGHETSLILFLHLYPFLPHSVISLA